MTDNLSSIELTRTILFPEHSVRRLKESDFSLSNRERICLKYNDCILVLFYTDNTESSNLAQVWHKAANQAVGPIFAACHLKLERKVAEAFTDLNKEPSHPLHWAKLQQMPFIMVYRDGWPVAFYNGDKAVQPIVDYSLTLACRAEYREFSQENLSMSVDENIEAPGVRSQDRRVASNQFKTKTPMRLYNNNLPDRVVPIGGTTKSSSRPGSPKISRSPKPINTDE